MIIRVIVGLLAVVLCWIGLLAAMMLVSDDAPAALVLLPDAALMQALPEGVSILSQTRFTITLAGATAQSLYHAGAVLVLPAGLLGCAPLTS